MKNDKARVVESIEFLGLALQAIERESATHHLINAQITSLGLLRIDPCDRIKSAIEVLCGLVGLPDDELLAKGCEELARSTAYLLTWIQEYDSGTYTGDEAISQPVGPADHTPTEAEQIVNAGDVSRRIRSGIAGAYGQFGEGVDVD